MNKELIKKYKNEFEHWLDGGKVLSKNTLLPEWSDNQTEDIWRIPSKDISKVLIIIDDSYSIYRKALAEGKTIQYRNLNIDAFKNWQNLENLEFNPNFEHRVKPESHKFKVGDWVIHNGVYKQVTKAVDGYIDSLDNEVAVIMKEESLELWEPEDEKYFWYKNDLVRFHETQTNLGLLLESARGCSYYPAEKNFENYCEPFI